MEVLGVPQMPVLSEPAEQETRPDDKEIKPNVQIIPQQDPPGQVSAKQPEIDREVENLKKIQLLKELLDSGALTREEFELKKKEYLGL